MGILYDPGSFIPIMLKLWLRSGKPELLPVISLVGILVVKALTEKITLKVRSHPILDTRISFIHPSSITLRLPPLDSEMGWTGELWSKTKFLILEN